MTPAAHWEATPQDSMVLVCLAFVWHWTAADGRTQPNKQKQHERRGASNDEKRKTDGRADGPAVQADPQRVERGRVLCAVVLEVEAAPPGWSIRLQKCD